MIYDCALPIASLDLIYCIYILFDKLFFKKKNFIGREQLVAKFDQERAHMAANLVSDPPVYRTHMRISQQYVTVCAAGCDLCLWLNLNLIIDIS